jgi:hypothetical protein
MPIRRVSRSLKKSKSKPKLDKYSSRLYFPLLELLHALLELGPLRLLENKNIEGGMVLLRIEGESQEVAANVLDFAAFQF